MVERLKKKAKKKQGQLLAVRQRMLKIPFLSLLHDVFVQFQKQRVTGMAAESAYYIILAMFPFLIFIVSILGFLGRRADVADRLIAEIDMLPQPLLQVIEDFLMETLRSSNLTLMSFSMIGVIWASSNGFTVLIRGLDLAYDEDRTHSFFVLRGMGLLFTLFIGISILLLLVMVAFGGLILEQLETFIEHDIFAGTLLQWLRFLVAFGLLFVVFLILYMAVAYKKNRLRQAFPGAVFSATGWVLLTVGFSWYVNNFDRYARLYGSIAGLIILMAWIYLCCNILLVGGILNSVLHDRRVARRKRRQLRRLLRQQTNL